MTGLVDIGGGGGEDLEVRFHSKSTAAGVRLFKYPLGLRQRKKIHRNDKWFSSLIPR
jgi:hypothetical protein